MSEIKETDNDLETNITRLKNRANTLRRGCVKVDGILKNGGVLLNNTMGNIELIRHGGNSVGFSVDIESLLSILGKTKGKE